MYVCPITSLITIQSLPLHIVPSSHFRLATITSAEHLPCPPLSLLLLHHSPRSRVKASPMMHSSMTHVGAGATLGSTTNMGLMQGRCLSASRPDTCAVWLSSPPAASPRCFLWVLALARAASPQSRSPRVPAHSYAALDPICTIRRPPPSFSLSRDGRVRPGRNVCYREDGHEAGSRQPTDV